MRPESRDVIIIMIQFRVIGSRLRAAARWQDDGIMIGRLKCDAADARRGVRADDLGALACFWAEQRQDPALDHRDRCDPAVPVRFEFRVRAFIQVE